jgi:Mlc titration factor MtfA (ptsG expression regulator)
MIKLFIVACGYIIYKLGRYCKENEYYMASLLMLQYHKSLSAERQQILYTNFTYYKKLSEKKKLEFEKRVQHFLTNKSFIASDGFEITEQMKVMIAATAVQILFCRKAYYLSSFDFIELFEEVPVHVEVMRKKRIIQISWNEFKKGFDSLIDGYNPGLKIMAMALDLEHKFGEKSLFSQQTYKAFQKIYKQEAEKYILSGKSKYDQYNKVDRTEYFAVAVEYFFERPEHFNANQPAMYLALSKLLRQDPLGMYTYKEKVFE